MEWAPAHAVDTAPTTILTAAFDILAHMERTWSALEGCTVTDVRPFRGLRYDPHVVPDWGAVLAPPYDVISAQQRGALIARSPYQITQIETASSSQGGPQGGTEAAALLRVWRRDGVLVRDAEPGYYVAQHRFRHAGSDHVRTTIYAAVRLTPWADAQVLPHEWTMRGPKEERQQLRQDVRADISPLMSLVPDRGGAVAAALSAPVETLAEGVDAAGESHALSRITDAASVAALRDALAGERLYIADGHHRYEAALAYRDARAERAERLAGWSGEEPENFVLMGIIRAADPGLLVGPTHRVVHVPVGAGTLDAIRQHFRVTETPLADARVLLEALREASAGGITIGAAGLSPNTAHLLHADERAGAALPATVPASWAHLDAALLQYALLEPVLGIDEDALSAGAAVTYTHDAEEALAAQASSDATAVFLLNAPSMDQIFSAADAGDRMPQKSTYFTPKLPTGVMLYPFDE